VIRRWCQHKRQYPNGLNAEQEFEDEIQNFYSKHVSTYSRWQALQKLKKKAAGELLQSQFSCVGIFPAEFYFT